MNDGSFEIRKKGKLMIRMVLKHLISPVTLQHYKKKIFISIICSRYLGVKVIKRTVSICNIPEDSKYQRSDYPT